MKLHLQLLVESDTGEMVTTEEVAQLERHSLRPEDVGLTLAEAKQMLGGIQRVMVQEQLAEYSAEQSRCSDCGRALTRKGKHEIVFRKVLQSLTASTRMTVISFHYAAIDTWKRAAMNEACPRTSCFANHLTWPLRIICMASIP